MTSNSSPQIVLTSATAALGLRVSKYLLKLVPASSVTVSLYNPAGAPPTITFSGCTIVEGNFSKPDTLITALAGADRLLLVSYPSIAHQERVRLHRSAIDAAKRVGVGHVYYTSLAFAGGANENRTEVMQAHLDTGTYMRESGMTYTVVRKGLYHESWPLYLGTGMHCSFGLS